MLGKVDFSTVKDFEAVPAGDYDGQTMRGWEAKPTKAGDSTNIEVKFRYEDQDDAPRVHLQRYNLKPAALWKIKRDLIALGADPQDFESTDVDLEGVLNGLFGGSVPRACVLTFSVRKYTPEGGEEREQNELVKVVAA